MKSKRQEQFEKALEEIKKARKESEVVDWLCNALASLAQQVKSDYGDITYLVENDQTGIEEQWCPLCTATSDYFLDDFEHAEWCPYRMGIELWEVIIDEAIKEMKHEV